MWVYMQEMELCYWWKYNDKNKYDEWKVLIIDTVRKIKFCGKFPTHHCKVFEWINTWFLFEKVFFRVEIIIEWNI